ncbi:hypothetical protein AC792_00510 [Arthrobacter sp. RIT-PI-e]|uniref:hypothetical protein n=1 Tax=Arthrobacter sp. RIT-PI-e TaxID=1681197 RepID=UPI000675C907|nr:hypothetical protein [Arthrobacter sp. RIT-PI-e]KNC20470.1 hypothetical protein AC792_00510 [Arthrobacter sp. RIT-PI-e]
MMRLIHAPGDPVIATVDGISVRFAGIELLEPSGSSTVGPLNLMMCLYLSAVRGSETALRDARFRLKQQQRWEQVHAGEQDPFGFPWWPVESIYDRITTKLSDDLGTRYERAGGQVGGEGREWEMVLRYTTIPPLEARTLHVEFSVDGVSTGRTCKIALEQ